MHHPIEFEMLAKLHHAELLKEAAQARAARLARGDTRQPAVRAWTIALSLAVVVVGVVLFAGLLW